MAVILVAALVFILIPAAGRCKGAKTYFIPLIQLCVWVTRTFQRRVPVRHVCSAQVEWLAGATTVRIARTAHLAALVRLIFSVPPCLEAGLGDSFSVSPVCSRAHFHF